MKMTCVAGAVVLVLAAACARPVNAVPDDLTGAVLITHHVPQLSYTDDGTDWCTAYTPHAITASTAQIPRVDGPRDGVVWYVLAAWSEDKRWTGAEFGFESYTADLFAYTAWGPCYPQGQGLELPTAAWPGPGEGTAFVTTSVKWQGNYVPLYWFAGYAYGPADGSTVIRIGVDPANNTAEFANGTTPVQIYVVQPQDRGGLGVNIDGVAVHPVAIEIERACCDPTTYACTIRTEAACAAQGGIWREDLTTCSPNPCIPMGACCWGTTILTCTITSESECLAKPHPTLGHGIWKGEGVLCTPFPCTNTPVEATTWGFIKRLYQ